MALEMLLKMARTFEFKIEGVSISRPLNILLFVGDGFSQAAAGALGLREQLVDLNQPMRLMKNPCRRKDGSSAAISGDRWCRSIFPVMAEVLDRNRIALEDASLYVLSQTIRDDAEMTPFFQYHGDSYFSVRLPHAAQELRQLLYAAFACVHRATYSKIDLENFYDRDWPWIRMFLALTLPGVRVKVVSLNYDLFLERSFHRCGLWRKVHTAVRSHDDGQLQPWDDNGILVFKPHGSLRSYVPLNQIHQFHTRRDRVTFEKCKMNLNGNIEIDQITNEGFVPLPDLVPPAHAGSELLNPYCRHDTEIVDAALTADAVIVFGASGRGPDFDEFAKWLKSYLASKKPLFYVGTPASLHDKLYQLLSQAAGFCFISTEMNKLGVPHLLSQLSLECGVHIPYDAFTLMEP
jgi:hypothetical protein